MKFLIVGLGNPGPKYEDTRHNIGFKAADALVSHLSGTFKPSNFGDLAELKTRGRKLLVLKPNTFMNLSGNAVKFWLQKEGIPVDKLLVLTDDINLDFGVLRLRGKGSDGGHNGISDIIAKLNSTQFPRLRIGLGNDFSKGRQVDYVLGEWSEEELKVLPELIERARDAAISFCSIGLAHTMSKFNG